MNHRPDPDKILKHALADEKSVGRGRLKLFFGAGPGVGKTYAMLEAAKQRKKEGWDVVIGLVETHGRAETEALTDGFEVLPRKEIFYKGVTLKELDLDAALRRQPRLVVVDELAHTNAPGSRHAKRWQDVEELLDAGIDVYTALNVQHWESLNDVVAQITGVVVRETVPDTFLNRMYELELVDLSPDDLLQRLKDGKVYKGEVAGRAADNFFQPGNLLALRELALRHAAERVDAQMQAFKERHSIDEVWSVGERLLVGISASPISPRLIRAAHRLATRLRAPWIAVHVETPAFLRLPAEERGRAIDNMRLAEKLGAEIVTLTGADTAEELMAFARARNITRIILGKPARPRWKEWMFGSVVNEIARHAGNIDLHIISGIGTDLSGRRPVKTPSTGWTGIAEAVAVVALCTLISACLFHRLDRVNLVMIYLVGVMWAAYRFGSKASFLASILSVLTFDFFFIPPYLSFAASDSQYVLTFAIMLGAGLLISTMAGRLRQQTSTLGVRAERMRVLYKLSRDLSETPETRQMLGDAATQLEEFYKLPVLILTPGAQRELEIRAGDALRFGWNENEMSVARWVFEKSQMAGAGSDTLSGALGLYLPLKGLRNTAGVLGIRPNDPKMFWDPEQLQLLETFASTIGGALESTLTTEMIGRAETEMELQAMKNPKQQAPLRISDFLKSDRIVFLQNGLSKEQIFRELLARVKLPNPAKALQAILGRENAGATLLGNGVAVPHARIPDLNGLELVLGLSTDGPIHLWFVFLSPTEDPKLHLVFLATVASFFQNAAHVEALRKLNVGPAVLGYFRAEEGLS